MTESEFEIKKFYVYNCWRARPTECRYGWESPTELNSNSVKCPKCGSYSITVKTIEKRVLKQTPKSKPSKPQEASKA